MPIVRVAAPLKRQPVWHVSPQGWRIPGPAPKTRLGITAPRPWIETLNPSYYYPAQQAPAKAAAAAKPLLVLPSVPTEPLPAGGQFEIQAGPWKVVLTKEEAAAAEVSLIDRIKVWLAEETIVAGYANQWFVVGGALAYFLLRKK